MGPRLLLPVMLAVVVVIVVRRGAALALMNQRVRRAPVVTEQPARTMNRLELSFAVRGLMPCPEGPELPVLLMPLPPTTEASAMTSPLPMTLPPPRCAASRRAVDRAITQKFSRATGLQLFYPRLSTISPSSRSSVGQEDSTRYSHSIVRKLGSQERNSLGIQKPSEVFSPPPKSIECFRDFTTQGWES